MTGMFIQPTEKERGKGREKTSIKNAQQNSSRKKNARLGRMNGEIERRVTLVLDIYESSSEKKGGAVANRARFKGSAGNKSIDLVSAILPSKRICKFVRGQCFAGHDLKFRLRANLPRGT